MKALTQSSLALRNVGVSPVEVRSLWQQYFPNILLTDTKWFEKYEPELLERAMQLAAEQTKASRFGVEDEINIGKYLIGIVRNLQDGKAHEKLERWFVVKSEFCFTADYEITSADRDRFAEKLTEQGDHWLFRGASTTGGYKKFWANGRSLPAHFFAFFADLGYLPKANGLGGVNGLQVAHACGLRDCCNPKHLRLTTKGLNLLERRRPLVDGAGHQIHCANPTDYGSANVMPLRDTKNTPFGTSIVESLDHLSKDKSVTNPRLSNSLSAHERTPELSSDA